jgi:hypothetical protein
VSDAPTTIQFVIPGPARLSAKESRLGHEAEVAGCTKLARVFQSRPEVRERIPACRLERCRSRFGTPGFHDYSF